MVNNDVVSYALRQLEKEITDVSQQLESLRDKRRQWLAGNVGSRARGGAAGGPIAQAATTPGKRKRSPMTAAQRKAVAERMRKYWAGRRAASRRGTKKGVRGGKPRAQANETPAVLDQ